MSGPTILVRSARPEDLADLVGFNRAMAEESEDKLLSVETLEQGIRYLLEHEAEGFYLVAEANGVVAGSLMVTYEWSDWRNGRFWWIQSVYVAPGYRRQGVYRALHENVVRQAKQDPGSCGIRLYVEVENTGAQATYARLGMHETRYRLYEEEF